MQVIEGLAAVRLSFSPRQASLRAHPLPLNPYPLYLKEESNFTGVNDV